MDSWSVHLVLSGLEIRSELDGCRMHGDIDGSVENAIGDGEMVLVSEEIMTDGLDGWVGWMCR